ncbi:MAG TPA: ubiquinone biosynthesis regulatory protein kinase UbiB [Steroidobacteraceae bacterium]|jgi:ubiquinone biosynthesis protein|nr:ubiquinone biosynthesis regulatory protein kinase UbiB [Steroidobacteraceae bacterium]
MISLRVAGRLLTIHRALVRYGLDDFVRATHLYRPLRFVFWLSPWTWFSRRRGTRGERLRRALEDLGPIFVKFGQVVSTRRDLLPPDIADELAKLQDRVPPFDGELAKARIEGSLGRPVSVIFGSFDPKPLAAASIAQVHAATLPDGRDVVVKVLRPGMREAIDLDLEVLATLAALAEEYWPESRRFRPREVVVEYEKTILNELDLMREAANASQLRRNFAGSPLLHVPDVHWDLCRQDVMVMERIRGVQISEVERLRELGTDIRKLAENGVEIFFTQVFRHNFFHADMHPGNIFVDVGDPANPRYAAVDFGIMGTLEPRDQLYLAGNFLAFFERNYRRVAELHLESGWVPPGTRVDELESAVRTVCEPIFDKPLKDISFGLVLLHLFEIARRYRMQVQPQLILLQKTLLNIEGLGRELYPELDLWKTALPILRDWMRERSSPRSVVASLRAHWPDVADAIRAFPVIARRTMRRAYDDELAVKTESESLERLRAELRRQRRRSDGLFAAGVVFLGGIVWTALATRPGWVGWALAVGGALWMARQLTRR